MSYYAAVDLDLLDEAQALKATTANNFFKAASASALWGVRLGSLSGLQFPLYGGNMNIAGVPTAITSQTVTLTANAINYIYATSAGVVTKTTSIPSGWPGPLAAGAIALYKLDVGASSVDTESADTLCYVNGMGQQGDAGVTGADGPAGTDLAATRKRLWMTVGGGSTGVTYFGWEALTFTGTAAAARALASSSLRESIPYAGFATGASSGSSAQINSPRNFCYLGNAAGRGGFSWSIRFCFESASSPANQRCFFGLIPVPGTLADAEPDALTNIIGIGAKAGEANLSLIYNDASGTATKTLLNSDGSPTVNFAARATDNVYEFTLISVGNSGVVAYELTNLNTGDQATGTINSNLPSNTTFLSWVAWLNNGSTASAAAMGLMQVVGETRY